MGIIEFIGKLIVAIFSLIAVAYAWSWIAGGISKLFGTTIVSKSGTVISTPNTVSENIAELKILKNKFVSNIGYLKEKYRLTKIQPQEKIKLFSELDILRKNGTINESEFFELKKQIMDI